MTRNAIKRCMGACLLGSALATGCSQVRSWVNDLSSEVALPLARHGSDMPVVAQRKVEESQAQLSQNMPAPATLPPVTLEQKATVNDASINQSALDSSKPSLVGELASVRKPFADLTAHPCFNHAEDYTCLSGQLQHSHISKSWRLRYAPLDEVERYGGSVTLIDDVKLSGLKDGDLVRLHGCLVNPEERGIAPPYEIKSIQPIDKRE